MAYNQNMVKSFCGWFWNTPQIWKKWKDWNEIIDLIIIITIYYYFKKSK